MRPNLKRAPWSAATESRPVAAAPGRDFGARSYRRPVVGLIAVIGAVAAVGAAVAMFNGTFTQTAPVAVMTDRAGLLMERGAKVKLNGAQIGTVAAVDQTRDGRAKLTLAIEPARLGLIPDNVRVEIGANTVFGAKSVEFLPPAHPSTVSIRAGQVLDSEHVTVETNTIFTELNSVLSHIDPVKLNETLGAISTAFSGRGETFGQSLSDFNSFLATLEPSLPQLTQELQVLPDVTAGYADAGPDLMTIFRHASAISRTLVDEQSNLDRFLVSAIGLADAGNDVIGGNRESLANLLHLMVPTTDLTNEYHEALNCAATGILKNFVGKPPTPVPGVYDIGAVVLGMERYRYPQDLPKVAATGAPQCAGQLPLRFNEFPAKVVADVGTNPARYGNQGLLLNSDGLKQWLFGPIDGPPRNTAQYGQPG
ncbi:MCE-family protein [Mycolicibacterium novocastrense]|uniref:MCE family protein n=1 Tax=Mycolicibacterium novocastrense TaxID=59813 RepID=UPI0007465BAC|nr:MCE family protein [Mycolicibacterium novocastrense]KUH64351.1 MCE-family protein [Mycolicibacterium novocastrense]KUH65145.1 MCE-family protein [Mycolicibacterium novocastrense]KUH76185.1 MCE-family protein [Mycolicibacterium novocastrense]